MRAPLSIVIPTLNSADELPGTLVSLMAGVESGLVRELIVADGGSTDDTVAIAERVGARVVTASSGRGVQLNAGARCAGGDWLFFLHDDTHLGDGWADAFQDHIATNSAAGFLKLGFRAKGVAPAIVAVWANIRSGLGLPYGDQGLLVSRALFDTLGGYQDIPLMEDVAMARALRGQLVRLPVMAMTSARRYHDQGWIRRGGRNILILISYLCGSDPHQLAARYYR